MPAYSYTKLYLRPYGSSSAYSEFPYVVGGVNTLPPFSVTQNDMDKDTYTNTKGKLVRNKIRDNVNTRNFKIPTMTGVEVKEFFRLTKGKTWLQVVFFDEAEWDFVTKKMYRSATVAYDVDYVDEVDPLKNRYSNFEFSLIEE